MDSRTSLAARAAALDVPLAAAQPLARRLSLLPNCFVRTVGASQGAPDSPLGFFRARQRTCGAACQAALCALGVRGSADFDGPAPTRPVAVVAAAAIPASHAPVVIPAHLTTVNPVIWGKPCV